MIRTVDGLYARATRFGERIGERHPTATVGVVVAALLIGVALSLAALARNWDRVAQPVVLAGSGAVAAVVLLAVWVWVWRGDFRAPAWLNVPLWILPVAAVLVALSPGTASASLSMLAYGFLIPHLLGGALLSVVGRLEARRYSSEERRTRARRALQWISR